MAMSIEHKASIFVREEKPRSKTKTSLRCLKSRDHPSGCEHRIRSAKESLFLQSNRKLVNSRNVLHKSPGHQARWRVPENRLPGQDWRMYCARAGKFYSSSFSPRCLFQNQPRSMVLSAKVEEDPVKFFDETSEWCCDRNPFETIEGGDDKLSLSLGMNKKGREENIFVPTRLSG